MRELSVLLTGTAFYSQNLETAQNYLLNRLQHCYHSSIVEINGLGCSILQRKCPVGLELLF